MVILGPSTFWPFYLKSPSLVHTLPSLLHSLIEFIVAASAAGLSARTGCHFRPRVALLWLRVFSALYH